MALDFVLPKGEAWKPVLGWEDRYYVSDDGKIFSVFSKKILKASVNSYGYPSVHLAKNGRATPRAVHLIMCEAFHGAKPGPRHQAAHNNGVRTDNRIENLRWATPKENQDDRKLHGTHCKGEANPIAKLTKEDVKNIREAMSARAGGKIIRDGVPRKLAAQYGVHRSNIYQIARGDAWG